MKTRLKRLWGPNERIFIIMKKRMLHLIMYIRFDILVATRRKGNEDISPSVLCCFTRRTKKNTIIAA